MSAVRVPLPLLAEPVDPAETIRFATTLRDAYVDLTWARLVTVHVLPDEEVEVHSVRVGKLDIIDGGPRPAGSFRDSDLPTQDQLLIEPEHRIEVVLTNTAALRRLLSVSFVVQAADPLDAARAHAGLPL